MNDVLNNWAPLSLFTLASSTHHYDIRFSQKAGIFAFQNTEED